MGYVCGFWEAYFSKDTKVQQNAVAYGLQSAAIGAGLGTVLGATAAVGPLSRMFAAVFGGSFASVGLWSPANGQQLLVRLGCILGSASIGILGEKYFPQFLGEGNETPGEEAPASGPPASGEPTTAAGAPKAGAGSEPITEPSTPLKGWQDFLAEAEQRIAVTKSQMPPGAEDLRMGPPAGGWPKGPISMDQALDLAAQHLVVQRGFR